MLQSSKQIQEAMSRRGIRANYITVQEQSEREYISMFEVDDTKPNRVFEALDYYETAVSC